MSDTPSGKSLFDTVFDVFLEEPFESSSFEDGLSFEGCTSRQKPGLLFFGAEEQENKTKEKRTNK